MSFDYNPYNHIEVTHVPGGNYKLYCHGCGKHWGDYVGDVPAQRLFKDMAAHIGSSHQRTRKDFEGWTDL